MTNYHLRKLVDENAKQLVEFLPELPPPVTLDTLLAQIPGSPAKVSERMQIIESLVVLHKKVVQSPATSIEQKLDLERRIWISLGVPLPEKSNVNTPLQTYSQVKNCLIEINKHRHQAVFYLGDIITTKYLVESRPSDLYWERYIIAPKVRVTFDGDLEEYLSPDQIEQFTSWISNFGEKCGNVLNKIDEKQDDALLDNFQ